MDLHGRRGAISVLSYIALLTDRRDVNRSMTVFPYPLDDYGVEDFIRLAADYGEDRFGFVVTPNADHLIRFHEDQNFRSAYSDAAYILQDSRFLAHLFRLTKGVNTRVCPGSDLTERLFRGVITPNDRVVLIGASAAQAESLRVQFGLKDLRHHNPPMAFIKDSDATEACLQFVEASSPFRFCFLAVGAPQQEMIAQRLKTRGVARGLCFCVGASVDFLTGAEKRAPVVMQRLGLEWLFRLLQNPRRLARRYLVRGPRLFALLGATQVKIRQRRLLRPASSPVAQLATPGAD
jgi:exopolysaccharide biosynthesis WecB/TagA/CpsF family protein